MYPREWSLQARHGQHHTPAQGGHRPHQAPEIKGFPFARFGRTVLYGRTAVRARRILRVYVIRLFHRIVSGVSGRSVKARTSAARTLVNSM